MASITRIQVMLVKNTDYNTASIFLGSSPSKIIVRNIMPRILPVIAQQASLAIPSAIGLDATLTFLGFGYVDAADTHQSSLGLILSRVLDGTEYQQYPSLIIFPVIMITLISLLFYLVGKVFSDSLDPKNHR
jgi:oligopeptide transport system permease protein